MKRTRAFVGPAAVAVSCVLGIVYAQAVPTRRDEPVAPASPPTEQAIAMLGGLHPGDTLVGWTVLGIDGPHEGKVRVDLGRDAVRFSITVAPLGTELQSAPLSTDAHALYYGHPHPRGTSLPPGAVRALLHRIADRVRAHEREDARKR